MLSSSSRQFFSDAEKICLQALVVKHNLHKMTTSMGNSHAKKLAWNRLTEEFNFSETNAKRTESQLKKCWDNLKTRQKAMLTIEKREKMRTGGGTYRPDDQPQPGNQESFIVEALLKQTDVEFSVVSDTAPWSSGGTELPSQPPPLPKTPQSDEDTSRTTGQRGAKKNVRSHFIEEEFALRRAKHIKNSERDEQIHKLLVVEKEWVAKAAEETYKKARIEREAAEETSKKARIEREAAEETSKKARIEREAAEETSKKARIEREAAEELLHLNRAKRLLAESELNSI